MRSKKVFGIWAQKFIYGWLIFCLGGIGSLTYFDGFLPGHDQGQHPYHLSLFEAPNHHHDSRPHSPEPESLAQPPSLWLISRFGAGADFIIAQQHLAAGLAQFFASGLNDGYLSTMAHSQIFNDTSPLGSLLLVILTGHSALLPPPEKPPQSNLA
jgi:hypothetical protein